MNRRSFPILALLLLPSCKYFRPLFGGGSDSSTHTSKLVAEYKDQLDIYSNLERQPAEAGFATPVLHVTVTNTGNRNVNFLKLVITLDHDTGTPTTDYHDIRVLKPLTSPEGETTLLARDGGTTSFLVHFKNAPSNFDLRPNIRLTEIGFTK
jgi:hypothetical protein